MIAAALIAALLGVVPAPARGDSNVSMVYVDGWYRLNQVSPDYPETMEFARPSEHEGFTLPAGRWVDVYFGGSCTIGGVTRWSSLLYPATCYGSGG